MFVSAGMWDKAVAVAERSGDGDLAGWVREEQAKALTQAGDADGLAAAGAGRESLDVLVKRGQVNSKGQESLDVLMK